MTRLSSTRILLDTNAWNYLADHADAAGLAAAARRGNATIVVAPAVCQEPAINDRVMLRARSQLLTDERWKRLMPEAYSECQEVLSQVRRFRPEWLLAQPPKGDFSVSIATGGATALGFGHVCVPPRNGHRFMFGGRSKKHWNVRALRPKRRENHKLTTNIQYGARRSAGITGPRCQRNLVQTSRFRWHLASECSRSLDGSSQRSHRPTDPPG